MSGWNGGSGRDLPGTGWRDTFIGSTLVRDIGRLEQRLEKDAARRRRVTAISQALVASRK
jgi:hypothetical protein